MGAERPAITLRKILQRQRKPNSQLRRDLSHNRAAPPPSRAAISTCPLRGRQAILFPTTLSLRGAQPYLISRSVTMSVERGSNAEVRRMPVRTDLIYQPEHEFGVLDLYTPEGPGPFPVVVCIHGGGWYEGRKEGMGEFAGMLIEAGIAAVAPDYRLTGTHPHPAQQEDIFATLDWVADHAREHRLDPGRVGLTGSSAGGHLAALVGLKATTRSAERHRGASSDEGYVVRCMLPICGVHDLSRRMTERPDRRHVLEALLGGPAGERMHVLRDASPVEHVHADAPPCLAVHGAEDTLVPPEHSRLLVEALTRVGAQAELMIVPSAGHGRHQPNTQPPEPLGGRAVFQGFFRKHLLAG